MSLINRFLLFLLLCLNVIVLPRAELMGNPEIADLKKRLEGATGINRIRLLNHLASSYRSRAPETCIRYVDQVFSVPSVNDFPAEAGRAAIIKGEALSILGRRDDALKAFFMARDYLKKAGEPAGIVDSLNALGRYYRNKGFYNISLKYYLKAHDIILKQGLKDKLARMFWHLGGLYMDLDDHKRALEYYKKGLAQVTESGLKRKIPYYQLAVGQAYQKAGEWQKALEYNLSSLKGMRQYGDSLWLSAILDNTGKTYGKLGKPGEGLKYLLESKRIQETQRDWVDFYTYLLAAGLFEQTGDFGQAETYYRLALRSAVGFKDDMRLKAVYQAYAAFLAARGNYREAYEYNLKYGEIRDKLVNLEKNRRLAELEAEFERERQEHKILLLENENRLHVSERNVFILGFVLLFLVSALFFKKYLYLFSFWRKQKYISQYRLVRKIGTGGMGTVYEAHVTGQKNEIAAVKVLREELAEDEINRQRFKREGAIVDRLEHPNIIDIYERGESGGRFFIAMELVRGETLARKIAAEGAFAMDKALPIMKSIAGTLLYIHDQKIIHRDLKPSNIMVTEEPGQSPVIKLLDFGMAMMKFDTRLTQSGALVGTIQYIAPEQITDNLYSAAGDIYALGVTFYEMLTGEPVFAGDGFTMAVERILDTKPLAPLERGLDVPPQLNEIILKMLEKKPAKRPDANEVMEVLETIG